MVLMEGDGKSTVVMEGEGSGVDSIGGKRKVQPSYIPEEAVGGMRIGRLKCLSSLSQGERDEYADSDRNRTRTASFATGRATSSCASSGDPC